MIRLAVVALATFGAYFFFGRWFPQFHDVAFTLAGSALTWLGLACCATALFTYRITK